MIRIEPAPGRQVRDLAGQPVTGPIEVDGRTAYWRRRLNAGDMVVSPEPVAASKPPRARPAPRPKATRPAARPKPPSEVPAAGPAPRIPEA
jgi:hypothetical protein